MKTGNKRKFRDTQEPNDEMGIDEDLAPSILSNQPKVDEHLDTHASKSTSRT